MIWITKLLTATTSSSWNTPSPVWCGLPATPTQKKDGANPPRSSKGIPKTPTLQLCINRFNAISVVS